MRKHAEREQRLLLFSVTMAFVTSVFGIVIGVLSQSQLILFDGLYSLISLSLSITTLITARFMARNDWKRYPFGKAAAEPLAIFFNYTVLLVVAIQFILEAVGKLFYGGQEIATGLALFYSLTVTALSALTFGAIRLFGRGNLSGLIKIEADGWFFDTLVSAVVIAAFVLADLMSQSPEFRPLARYIDPLFVILISSLFVRLSLKEIWEAVKEILDVSPQTELTEKLHDLVEEIEEEYRLSDSYVRVSQGRRLIWVEIDFVVDENSLVKTVQDEDEIREKIHRALRSVRKVDKWITIAFTANPRWAR